MSTDISWRSVHDRPTRQILGDDYSDNLVELARRGDYRVATLAQVDEWESILCLIPGPQVRARRTSLGTDPWIPTASVEELSRPVESPQAHADRLCFLSKVSTECLGGETFAQEVKNQYESLYGRYWCGRDFAFGAVGDLSALREENHRQLSKVSRRIAHVMESIAAPILLVLYWETCRAIETKPGIVSEEPTVEIRRGLTQVDHVFFGNWRDMLMGASASALWGEGFSYLRTIVPDLPKELVKLQATALEYVLSWRDSLISEALPLEFRRIACGLILTEVAEGVPVDLGEDEDLDGQLPGLRLRKGFPLKTATKREHFVTYVNWLKDERESLVELTKIGDTHTKFEKSGKGAKAVVIQKLESELRTLGETIESVNEKNQNPAQSRIDGMLGLGSKFIVDF